MLRASGPFLNAIAVESDVMPREKNSTGQPKASFDEKEYKRQWRDTNKEKLRNYFRGYRSSHPELKDYHASYYLANKSKWEERRQLPETKARQAEYGRKNRWRQNEARRKARRDNPELVRARDRERNAKRRDKKRASDKRYREANPDKCRTVIKQSKAKKPQLYKAHAVMTQTRRRVRKRNGIVERVSHRRIVERDHHFCHLCLLTVAPTERSFDHLIPVCRQGAHAEWNIMLAHLNCNKKRGSRQILPEETEAHARAYIASHGRAFNEA